jgi:uncharacterized membrane protein YfcA
MFIHQLDTVDFYSPWIIAILIVAGFMVGFINTLAGSGTVITYSVFMALGLPASIANGTIRIGVIFQTFASSVLFKRDSLLDVKMGLKLGLPTALGSIIGAQVAININFKVFEYIVGGLMLLMLFFLFLNPTRWIEGRANKSIHINPVLHFVIYLLIGFYGGFIHVGVGFFLLAALVLVSGYDLLKANAVKIFIVMLYSPFALVVYMLNDHVHYAIALITAIGNTVGGIVAAKLAIKKGSRFIHWFLVIVIIIFTANTFGLFSWIEI